MATTVKKLFGSPFFPPDSENFLTHCKLSVQSAIRSRESADKSLEQNIASLLKEERYKILTYSTRRGHRGKFNYLPFTSWRQFCETPAPYGLGYSPEYIDALLGEKLSAPPLEIAERVALQCTPADRRVLVQKLLALEDAIS